MFYCGIKNITENLNSNLCDLDCVSIAEIDGVNIIFVMKKNISFVNFKCNFSCIVTVYNLSGLFVVSANEMDMKWIIAICIVDIE